MKTPEKLLSRRLGYKGKNITVFRDIISLKGRKLKRDLITHPGSAVILPILDLKNKTIILIRQYRYAAKMYMIEAPAGTRDKGESTLACAKREIMEETGYKARRFKKIVNFYPTPGVMNENMDVYIATGLTPAVKKPDWDEDIEVIEITLDKALNLIEKGKIRDAKTITSLLMLERLLNSKGKKPHL
ncbi:MAG: ADP-ribose pyrophosphatase [Candidatus Aerophobetes bacterium ADurb.Bin490]|nr:MAG: ADP-ribose pyrophosphatase [Candidatus Aerophobetes bacterium ADurb.Bin490]